MTNPFAPKPAAPATTKAPSNPFGGAQQAPPAAAAVTPAWLAAPPTAAEIPAPTAAAPRLGSFAPAAPVTIGGGSGAKLADMYGRLVLVLPLSISIVPKATMYITPEQAAAGQTTQPRMVATFVVLDGESPIAFGGDLYAFPQKPHTKSEPLPHVSKALWISQSKLLEQTAEALAQAQAHGAGAGMVLGRLLRGGNEKNSPWILGEYSAEDAQRAQYYLDGVASGQFPNPLA